MKRRLLIGLIIASMIIPWVSGITIPMKVEAAASADDESVDPDVYSALGLNTDMDVDSVSAPYSESGKSQMYTVSEIYVKANGKKGSVYNLRNGFDNMTSTTLTDKDDRAIVKDLGTLRGAYGFYGISATGIDPEHGDTTESTMSSNENNVLKNEISETLLDEVYATSVAFKGNYDKDNYVAELVAYGKSESNNNKGKIAFTTYQIDDDGTRSKMSSYDLGSTSDDSLMYNDAYFYFSRMYTQDLDAAFEIEAADLNGDGIDDLMMYYGAYEDRLVSTTDEGAETYNRYAKVDVYFGVRKGRFSKGTSVYIDCGNRNDFAAKEDKEIMNNRPVVTIAGGDIDKDNDEEFAVAVSAPTDHKAVSNVAKVNVYDEDPNGSNSVKVISGLENIAIKGSDGKAAVAVNVTFGDFVKGSQRITTIIAAGYESNNATTAQDSGAYTKVAYRTISYQYGKKNFKITDYTTFDLGENSKKIAEYYNVKDKGHYRPNHAPLALACANLDGIRGDGAGSDSVLFGAEVYEFDASGMIPGDEIGKLSVCDGQQTDNDNDWKKEQVWISDVQTGIIDTDPQAAGYREAFIGVVGVRRDGKIDEEGKAYDWMDITTFIKYMDKDGKYQGFGTQEGVFADGIKKNDTNGGFVSLCLPDVGDDSVTLKFKRKYTIISNPIVYAVLQASPYFDDLAEAYPDYINNGGTSYSTSTSSSTSHSASVECEVGVWAEGELSFLAAAKFSTELGAGASYEYSYDKTTEYTIEYNNAAGGGNQVVLFCNKYVYFEYEVWDPNDNSGKWKTVVMPMPIGVSTSIVDVEKYDDIASTTDGLDTIEGSLLYNTPGDPASYRSSLGGTNVYEYENKENSYSSCGSSSGSDQTQTIAVTTSNSHEIGFFAHLNQKIGGGAGAFGTDGKAGGYVDLTAGYAVTTSSSDGITYSGTVDNVPEEINNFSFDWKLLVNKATINGGSSVWIVGYDTRNVVRPPHMPLNLSVVNVTKDTVELEWEPSAEAAYYEIFIVDDMNYYNRKAIVPYTITDYVVPGLDPKTTYKFAIRAIGSTGEKSLTSKTVSATTLGDNSNFAITKQPEDASTYAGGSVSFSTTAVYYDKNMVSQKVGYEWQKYENGKWVSIGGSGSNLSTYTIDDVDNSMNGNQYRCRVYFNQITLFSEVVSLTVSKAMSKTVLSAYNVTQGKDIPDEGVVKASGSEAKSYETDEIYKKSVKVTKSGMEYTLVSNGTDYLWKDIYNNYYVCSKNVTLDEYGRVDKDITFSESDIADSSCDMVYTNPTAEVYEIEDAASGKYTDKTYNLTKVDLDTVNPKPQVSFTDGDVTYNKVIDMWTSSDVAYNFYLLTNAAEDSQIYYYVDKNNASNNGLFTYSDTENIKLSETKTIDASKLKQINQTVVEKVTKYYPDLVSYTGDKVKLTAAVVTKDGEPIPNSTVYFYISGPLSPTIKATYNSAKGVYEADWLPNAEGTFTVYTKFQGDGKYISSKSEEMTIYTAFDDDAKLSISAPATVMYGDRVDVKLTKIDSKNGNISDVTKSDSTTFKVLFKENKDFVTANESDYTFTQGVFVPKNIGSYRIVGENDGQKESVDIRVLKADLTISAVDVEKGFNDTDRGCGDAEIEGLKSWDNAYTPVKGTDYTLSSTGETSITAGTYTINCSLKTYANNAFSSAISYLYDRYNISLNTGKYELSGNVYEVSAETVNSHGTVAIEYKQNAESSYDPIEVDSGTKLPENAEITITAASDTGYAVKKWTVNGKTVTDKNGGTSGTTIYTGSQINIPSLNKDAAFTVEFEPVYHSLSFDVNEESMGTVSANYLDGTTLGNSFESGSNIHVEQAVRITAEPKEGYAVDHWTITGDDGKEKAILSSDNKTNYSELTYDAKKISENTVITVYYVETDAYTITVNAYTEGLDGKASPAAGTEIVVTNTDGTKIEKNVDGEYNVSNGDNVTIKITAPSGLLIDRWAVGTDQKMGTVSNDLTTVTIYNIKADVDYSVYFKAPNKYNVEYAADKAVAGEVTAVIAGSTDKISSGSKQIQGADIVVTAMPNPGYEIAYWTANGVTVEATENADGSQKYTVANLSKDANVMVYFYKKPIITLDADGSADSSIKLGDDALESGDVISYANENKLTFTATAEKGYEVDDVVLVYGDKVLHKKSAEIADDLVVFTEDKDSTIGTELYTVEFTAPEGGIVKDVDVKITFKEIAPVISAKYSLVSIDNTAKSTHGKIAATVDRKELSAYAQTGEEVIDTEAEITDIYRDSVVTFTVTPDEGYNVKEWAINGTVIDAESDTIKITKTNKTNDTLVVTVDENAEDIVVTARLELVGDVLTYDVEPEEFGTISAKLKATGHNLVSGEKIGTTGKAEFTVTPDEGYEVVGWKINGLYALNEDGENVSDNPYTYTVEAGARAHVTAILDRVEYDITYSAEEGGSIDAFNTTDDIKLAEGTDKVRGGRKLQFEVTPDEYMMLSYYTITDADGERVVKAEDLEGDVLVIDSVESDITVVATFEKYIKKIKVTYEANDDDMGSVAATYNLEGEDIAFASEDEIVAGNKVDFVATPAEGYLVEGWYADPDFRELLEKSEDELTEYSFDKVDDDLEVYVKFIEIPTYEISLDVTGTGVGSFTAKVNDEDAVIEDGKVYVKKHGTVEITAVPKDEYNTLESWTVNDGEEEMPDSLTYTFTDVKENQTLVGKFSPALVVDVTFKGDREADHYADINIEAGYVAEDKLTEIDAENAIARIGSGKDVQLEIVPEEGYMLDSWSIKYSVNGNEVQTVTSEEVGYTNKLVLSNITSDVEITATLKEKLGFMVPAEGSYDYDGYKLDEEAYEDDSFDEATAYTISDLELNPTDVTFEDEEGDVIPNKVREHGDATFKVTPGKDKVVLSIEASEGADMEVTENEDGSYDVKLTNVVCDVELYVEVIPTYKLTIKECENGKITAIGTEDGKEYKDGDMVPFGTKITFTAVPDTHYAFESWTDVVLREILIIDPSDVPDDDPPTYFSDDSDIVDDNPDPETPNVPTENPFDYVMLEETVIGATFAPIMVTVTIDEPTNGSIEVKTADGTVLKTGDQVQEGTEIECTATPDAHYAFEAWGSDASAQKNATFKMTADVDTKISATFKPIMVIVDIDDTVNGKIEVRTPDGKLLTSGAQVQEGTVITCTAIPAATCKLGNWSGNLTGSDEIVKVVADANITIGAKFIAKDAESVGINKNIQARLKGKKITLKWGKVSAADGYEVYVQECYSEKTKAQKVKTIKGASKTKATITKYLGKSIKKYKELKIKVKAYKKVNGKKKYIDSSEMLHVVTNHKKLTNVKKNTPTKKSFTLEVGQKANIKTKLTKAEKKKSLLSTSHGKRLRYYCTNKNVAKVSKKGQITAMATGTCTVYVISVSGVTAAVKVTVK